LWTARTRMDDRLFSREAGDADIEKTADNQPHDKGSELDDAGRTHPMSIRFGLITPYVWPKGESPDLSRLVRRLCAKSTSGE